MVMNPFNKIGASFFLRRLLVEPEYRVARHLLLILIIIIISLNQAFMTFVNGLDVLGNKIFGQAFLILVSYLLTGYFNFFVLLPRYLLKKKYVQYTLLLAVSVFLMVTLQTVEERYILTCFGIVNESYDFPVIYLNMLSSFALILLSLSGTAMTILLKYWMTENGKMRELEKLHVQSEVEQLKEQVSPRLLFNILNRTGILATRQPAAASDMLLRLSQLLRYQLYDCNREQVLLGAEIKFLSNYLTLEQTYSHAFSFTIREDKGTHYLLIAPLLFISFVQAAVIRMYELDNQVELEVEFRSTSSSVTFCCSSEPTLLFTGVDYSQIRRRLNLLYPGHHTLNVTAGQITLNLEL